MKKFRIFLIVFAFILSNAIGVQADSEPKIIESSMSVSSDHIKVGESITLTAETLKHGSSYIEEWSGAQASGSYLDESTGSYISEAVFTPAQAGTYVITYTVRMYTGNSEVKFTGTASRTVEVISDKQVTGLEVRNITAKPAFRLDGTIKGYSVTGELYILWNDNTSSLSGTVFYFFLPDEKSRVVSAKANVDSQTYTFPVTISINQ